MSLQLNIISCLIIVSGSVFFTLVSSAENTRYDYRVFVPADLSKLSVEVRFDSGPQVFELENGDDAGLTHNPETCDRKEPLALHGNRLYMKSDGVSCVRYSFYLAGYHEHGHFKVDLAEDNRRVPVHSWLWLPSTNTGTEIRVRFMPASGVNISVPWQPDKQVAWQYNIGPSPQSGGAVSLFGRFDIKEVPVPGATLRVGLLKAGLPMDNAKILAWLRAAATDVTLAYGRFPSPSPQVIIVPVAKKGKFSRSAVPFGHVIRNGGEAVQFFVDQTRPLQDFLGDWTATHEFSHLMLPYIDSDQKWISEGFASYYQNVLLARAGVYTPRHAWQDLYDGFQRAHRESDDVSPNKASTMRLWDARMMIYWSGAALALMADVKLRRLSLGEETLDSVLGRLQACCLPSDKMWEGRAFFIKLDELSRHKIFVKLYDNYANSPGVPDLSADFHALGLSITEGKVKLIDNAPDISIRDDIMRVDHRIARDRGNPELQ